MCEYENAIFHDVLCVLSDHWDSYHVKKQRNVTSAADRSSRLSRIAFGLEVSPFETRDKCFVLEVRGAI